MPASGDVSVVQSGTAPAVACPGVEPQSAAARESVETGTEKASASGGSAVAIEGSGRACTTVDADATDEENPTERADVDDDSAEKSETESDPAEADDETVECTHDGCEATFDGEHGMRIHRSKAHGFAGANRDSEALKEVYERYHSFDAMCDALDADVSAQTVRRWMIDEGIHTPARRSSPSEETPADEERTDTDGKTEAGENEQASPDEDEHPKSEPNERGEVGGARNQAATDTDDDDVAGERNEGGDPERVGSESEDEDPEPVGSEDGAESEADSPPDPGSEPHELFREIDDELPTGLTTGYLRETVEGPRRSTRSRSVST